MTHEYSSMKEEYEAKKQVGISISRVDLWLDMMRHDFLDYIKRADMPMGAGGVLRAIEYCMVMISGLKLAGAPRDDIYELGSLQSIEIEKAEGARTPAQVVYENVYPVTPMDAWLAMGAAARYYREQVEAENERCNEAVSYLLTIEACILLLQALIQIEFPREEGYWQRRLDELLTM
jgi:hypothetical protein